MKEDHELIDDEELKEFFLTEAKLLCPSVEKEESECEKLQILYNTQQKIVKLLSVMNHCNFEMHYVEIYHVFGFYFTEKEGEKKKPLRTFAIAATNMKGLLLKGKRGVSMSSPFVFYGARAFRLLAKGRGSGRPRHGVSPCPPF